MEGLIKGLVDVAIGYDRGREEEVGTEEQRSRSSWAEVVSGEQDNEPEPNHGRTSNWKYEEDEQNRGRISNQREEWDTVGSRTARRPQKPAYEGYERSEYSRQDNYEASQPNQPVGEESNDDWEVVGKKKPPRRHEQVNKEKWDNYKRPATNQEYSDDVDIGDRLEPSQDELSDLALACEKLWDLDLNRLIPGKDYEIDCGEGKKCYQNQDMAEGCLFTYLNEEVFRRPTISRFCSLLDNYNPHEGYKEEVTSKEKQEEAAFIEEISRTAPIKYLHKYLCAKGTVSENFQEFKRMLTSLWFDLYGRGGTSSCSSAFEHVFVGEIKGRGDQEVSGFHNWLQFYMEEANGKVDYQGYIFPRRRGETPDSDTQLLTIQFEWNGVLKAVSSTLVGVSPEFEIALYTLCFYLGGEDNHVQLGPYSVNIKCYRHGNKLGSAFPIADS